MDGSETPPIQLVPNDTAGWKTHWEKRQQPWRTEPEIDAERQQKLSTCYAVAPDIEQGIYPFRGMHLTRADVEWLLATYGPNITPENISFEKGLDVRGAILDGEDLRALPLNCLRGGLLNGEWGNESSAEEQCKIAAVHMNNAVLNSAELKYAYLRCAQLDGAKIGNAQLEHADLSFAQLKGANLNFAQLECAVLNFAHLEGATLNSAWLKGANLGSAQLENADLKDTHLEGATLNSAQLENADLKDTHLEGAMLFYTHLENANLDSAHIENATLHAAHLKGAYLANAYLMGANLVLAQLEGSTLRYACLDGAYLVDACLDGANLKGASLKNTNMKGVKLKGANLEESRIEGANLNSALLEGANLANIAFAGLNGIGPQIVDTQWNGVNLAVADWYQIKVLGNEYDAQQKKEKLGNKKNKELRLGEHRESVRANRQLAVALQTQGLNEEATHFAYRANRLQRKVLYFQMVQSGMSFWQRMRKLGAWMFSHLLNMLAGYGYKPGRSAIAYLVIIFGFMGIYLLIGQFSASPLSCATTIPHMLSWNEALVLSLSSFHGRGFFPQTISLGDPYASAAVAEAVLGLLVEVSLIAAFTQRFFGK